MLLVLLVCAPPRGFMITDVRAMYVGRNLVAGKPRTAGMEGPLDTLLVLVPVQLRTYRRTGSNVSVMVVVLMESLPYCIPQRMVHCYTVAQFHDSL